MATLPNPHTWVAGDDATSGNLQTLTDAINFLKDPPRCHAYVSTAQNLASGTTFLSIALDAEEVDTDGIHSTSTNTSRFTAVTAGRYRVWGQVGFASNSTGGRAVAIGKNGASNPARQVTLNATTFTQFVEVYDEVLLSVGDYVELQAFQNSGGALALQTGATATFLHCVWASVS